MVIDVEGESGPCKNLIEFVVTGIGCLGVVGGEIVRPASEGGCVATRVRTASSTTSDDADEDEGCEDGETGFHGLYTWFTFEECLLLFFRGRFFLQ